jgi:hypothetical protein
MSYEQMFHDRQLGPAITDDDKRMVAQQRYEPLDEVCIAVLNLFINAVSPQSDNILFVAYRGIR